jgi:murein DD-endopeptidase MepM/ murein hydrolase activator NlpD
LGIPSRTRIILIPEDERPSREYGITRPMVITLLVLLTAFLVLVALLMISFADQSDERARIGELEVQLAEAQARARRVEQLSGELRQELLIMQSMQARLLFMLGVEETTPASADSLLAWLQDAPASTGEALARAATVTLSPPPDRWPTTGLVTKEFNKGNIPAGIKPHLGIDIAAATDTPVLAAGAGAVVRTGADEFLGNFVEIQHGLGYLTVYGHCSRIAVGEGDRVDGGQVIAYVGQSGQSSAPHLHFEIRQQGEAVNPREFLEGDPPLH